MATTWNPADKSSNISLTTGNLVALNAAGSAGDFLVRTTSLKSSGKWYWEVTLSAGTPSGECALGVANASETLSNFLGKTNNSCGMFSLSGHIFINNTMVGTGVALNTGHTYAIALDVGHAKIWWNDLTGGSGWVPGAGANPATNTGGTNISAITTPIAICDDVPPAAPSGQTDHTLNVGVTSFVGTVPSGFSAYDPTPPVTFDPTRGMFLLAMR